MQEIMQPEEVESIVAESANHPVFIFKHSTRCPISAGAYRRVSDYFDDANSQAEAPPPVYLVKVVESRPVSNAVAEDLRVPHQSPQMILVKDGQAVWSTTHHNINAETIGQAIAGSRT